MEDILAILMIFGGGTLVGVSFSPVGRAIADRIRHGKVAKDVGNDPEIFAELDAMRIDLHDVGERLDFAERLLAAEPSKLEIGEGD